MIKCHLFIKTAPDLPTNPRLSSLHRHGLHSSDTDEPESRK